MGWLCSKCGTENRIFTAKCRACRRVGSVWERADGVFAAVYEKLPEAAFARNGIGSMSRIAGGANRAAAAVSVISAAAVMLMLLYMSRDVLRSGELMLRMDRVAETVRQLGERAYRRGALSVTEGVGRLLSGGDLMAAGQRTAETLRMLLSRGGQRLSDHIALIGQELPLADLHITAWMLNLMYRLRDALAGADAQWMDVLADGVQLLCDGITELRKWQWSLRG